jgi:hypothetical protein
MENPRIMDRTEEAITKSEDSHPFPRNVPNDEVPRQGFIARYKRYVEPIGMNPPMFVVLQALTLLASAVQRQYYIREGDQVINLGLFTLLACGHSSSTNLTNALSPLMDLLDGYEQATRRRILLPNKVNYSALAALMTGALRDRYRHRAAPQKSGLIVYPDFSTPLSGSNKDFSGLIPFLVEIYDGASFTYSLTLKRGPEQIRDARISIIGVGTLKWLNTDVLEDEILTGFLSRCLFTYGEPQVHAQAFAPERDEELGQNLIDILDYLSGAERKDIGSGPYEMTYSAGAREVFQDWFRMDSKAETDEPSFLALAKPHDHMNAKKVAAVYQLGEDGKTEISEENMRRAISLVTFLRQHREYIFSAARIAHITKLREKLCRLIREKPGICLTEIQGKLRGSVNAEKIRNVLDGLIEAGRVQETITANPRGRPRRTYHINDMQPDY